MERMKKYILVVLGILCINGCGVTKRIVDVEREIVTYKDSTILNVKDSIVLVPLEKIVDIVPVYDTLKMETSLAKATAYVDTNYHIIRGSLSNKPEIVKESHIQYVDRIVERTDTLVKTETIEVPVRVIEYKIPKWCWLLLAFNILAIALFFLVRKPF